MCVIAICSTVFLAFTSGCGNKFFDPAQTGRFRPVPSVTVILDSLGVAEETDAAWTEGEDPRPADTVVMETDYVFQSGDIVRVSIFELLREGVQSINEFVVTETGKISIPDVGVVEAAGLTETQLEEEIRQILSPSILKDPSVVVILLASQQRTFSILGDGIRAPGRYAIPRYDYRLADALATAGGQRQFNVSYIYVSRASADQGTSLGLFDSSPGVEVIKPEIGTPYLTVPSEPGTTEMLEIIAPRVQGRQWQGSNAVIASSEMATVSEFGSRSRSSGHVTADNLGGLLSSETEINGGAAIGEPVVNGGAVTALVSEVEAGAGSETPGAGLLWEEPAEDEQISVADILKTLAARSQQEKQPVAASTGTVTAPAPTEVSAIDLPLPRARGDVLANNGPAPKTSPTDDAAALDSIMKTLADRPRSVRSDDRTEVVGTVRPSTPVSAVGRADAYEPGGVEDILAALKERPRAGQTETGTDKEPADWEKVLQSFAEPDVEEAKSENELDLDELLKSFAEPDVGAELDEQMKLDDVDFVEVDAPIVDVPVVGPGEAEVAVERGEGPEKKAVEVVEAPGRIEWVFQDGKWVPMQIGAPAVARPVIRRVEAPQEPTDLADKMPVGGLEWDTGVKTRLIKIPADKLMAGDPRYNIVVKPG
ncbi:MAG: polysaccharide biosynthesis/export family protein, partial [Planctomycetes bacterium]|nr:polysaccharide biosynthesis/export family protein [Planctomycetota bacterium]